MADRVAIIGGSTVGRDHFPFPARTLVADVPVGSGRYRPFYLTLDQMAFCFWRVRKWNFTLLFSYKVQQYSYEPEGDIYIPTGYEIGTGHISFDYVHRTFEFVSPIVFQSVTREAELVIGPRFGHVYSPPLLASLMLDGTLEIPSQTNYFDISNTSSSVTAPFTDPLPPDYIFIGSYLSHEIAPAPTAAYTIFDPSNPAAPFAPHLLFDVSADGGGNTYYDVEGSDETEAGSLSIDVGDTILSATIKGEAPIGDEDVIVTSLTAAITPIEYWPYATKAGLPVYDTSDGSVLNDPLS